MMRNSFSCMLAVALLFPVAVHAEGGQPFLDLNSPTVLAAIRTDRTMIAPVNHNGQPGIAITIPAGDCSLTLPVENGVTTADRAIAFRASNTSDVPIELQVELETRAGVKAST